jgi:Choline/ethanolamine kinase
VSTVEDMFDAEKAKMIAVKLARWHKVQPLADSDPNNHEDTKLWSTMRKWMNSGENSFRSARHPYKWFGILIFTLLYVVPAQYEDSSTQATFAKSIDMEFLKHEVKIKKLAVYIIYRRRQQTHSPLTARDALCETHQPRFPYRILTQ